MARTMLRGGAFITDGTIQRDDLDVSTAGQALLRKIIQGTGISISSTGADAGTGDVTIGVGSGVLQAGVTNTLSVGYAFTTYDLGTVSSGTVTPAAANGNYQKLTNNGAFTLAAPSVDCAMTIFITNGASAGSITFSGFTVGSNVGSTYNTTSGNKFKVVIERVGGVSTYSIYALQ